MNLFTISDNPNECFKSLDDVLMRKSLLECAQMISTAIRVNENIEEPIPDVLYKSFNAGEEHNVWVRENQSNYRWAFYYLMAGLDEYYYRFGKQHDAQKIARYASQFEKYFPVGRMTPFPRKFNKDYENYHELMAIPDVFKAYKQYLITKWNKESADGKQPIWTNREKPEFYK